MARRKKKPKKLDWLSDDLLKMHLAEYLSDRFPLSRIDESWPKSKRWVDDYLREHPTALGEASAKLDPRNWEVEQLIALLPGFWEFMRERQPGLQTTPTGLYSGLPRRE